jgi:streptogramin lyase
MKQLISHRVRLRVECLEDRCTPGYVPITEFSAGISNNSSPQGITAGPDGNIWFTEVRSNRIGRITPSGFVTEFSTGITAGSELLGIAAGPDGNVWFAEGTGNRIGRITPTGNVSEFSTGITSASAPVQIVAGPDGNLWFTELFGNRIGRITPNGFVTEFSTGITSASNPRGIAVGPDGNLWFTEEGGNRIGRITPSGTVTEFGAGITGGPSDIAPGADGNLWFTEQADSRIGRISTSGLATEFGLPTASFPGSIASGADGNLWFTEGNRHRIAQITRAGVVTEFPLLGGSIHTPGTIARGPDGNIWFTDFGPPTAIGKAVLPKPVVTGADAGGRPLVRVFDGLLGNMTNQFLAYNPRFSGGVRVAQADVNGDGVPDIITAPGPGGGPDIRVFDGVTGALIREFMAYSASFTGGVFVAAGDVNADGFADIVTGPDIGGGPDVRVFSGKDGSLLAEFQAFNTGFTGGVRVAVGDFFQDHKDNVIVAPGPGGGPNVRVFSVAGNVSRLANFMAYGIDFTGGVYVAAGDVNGDGVPDIITSPGAGGGPEVKVFSGANPSVVLQDFAAYSLGFTGGVRVSAADVDGDGMADIITTPGGGGGPDVRVFDHATLVPLNEFMAYDPSFLGGVFVA